MSTRAATAGPPKCPAAAGHGRHTNQEEEAVGVLDAVRGRVAAPGTLAWQLSAVPRQVLGVPTSDRATVPFLAAVVGTAVAGLVEWPVALLVGAGYLLSRSLARPDEHLTAPKWKAPSGRTTGRDST